MIIKEDKGADDVFHGDDSGSVGEAQPQFVGRLDALAPDESALVVERALRDIDTDLGTNAASRAELCGEH